MLRTRRTRRTLWTGCLAAGLVGVLVLAITAGPALAKKPVQPPPPDPDPVDTGTIYYLSDGELYRMAPDGSEKTRLGANVSGPPSLARHGGERWFLEVLPASDGDDHNEIFAVSESGTTTQLTNDPDVEPSPNGAMPLWMIRNGMDDGAVSYLAVERGTDGSIVDWGIFVAGITPSLLGSTSYSAAVPQVISLDLDLVVDNNPSTTPPTSTVFVDAHYEWAPDYESVIYTRDGTDADALWRSDWNGVAWVEESLPITSGVQYPRWSPDGLAIAYYRAGALETIEPDGTGQTIVTPRPGDTADSIFDGGLSWSPSGDHLIYKFQHKRKLVVVVRDVYRVSPLGGDDTNLTKDTRDFCKPIGWRPAD